MKYNVVDMDGSYWVELLEDPFTGIRYSYGKVEMDEPEVDGEDAIVRFEYHLQDQRLVVQLQEDKLFHKTIGDILIGMIEEQLAKGELIYKGGK